MTNLTGKVAAVTGENLYPASFLWQAAGGHMKVHNEQEGDGGRIIDIALMLILQAGMCTSDHIALEASIGGLTRPKRSATRQCSIAFPSDLGAIEPIRAVPRCSSRRKRRISCKDMPLAADAPGWLAETG